MTERAMPEGDELQMIKVPDLIQDYAQTYYERGIRNGCFRVFSHRQKFDPMTNDEVGKELDRLKTEIIEQYGDGLAVLRPHLGLGVTLTAEEIEHITYILDWYFTDAQRRARPEQLAAIDSFKRWVQTSAIAGRGEVERGGDGAQ